MLEKSHQFSSTFQKSIIINPNTQPRSSRGLPYNKLTVLVGLQKCKLRWSRHVVYGEKKWKSIRWGKAREICESQALQQPNINGLDFGFMLCIFWIYFASVRWFFSLYHMSRPSQLTFFWRPFQTQQYCKLIVWQNPSRTPTIGILPGFQVPEAVQLTFSKRYRVVVMYASLVCFLSQHLNLLHIFSVKYTIKILSNIKTSKNIKIQYPNHVLHDLACV